MQGARHVLAALSRPGSAAAAQLADACGAATAASTSGRELLVSSAAAFHTSSTSPPAAPQPSPSSSSSAAAAAAAAGAETAPAPASSSSKKKAPKGGGSGSGREPLDEAALKAELQQLKAEYRRSRMLDFYERILSRELLLKLNVKSVNELPRVDRVNLAIQAKDVAGGPYVEKWQLLLQALALEVATGHPASFARPSSRYYQRRNAVTGVHVSLSGAAAHDALEKVAYLLLPSQNAFEGLLARQIDAGGGMHFKVPSMVNLPDYEEMFETFESLRVLDVNITMRGVAKRPGRTRLLLTGLQLPVLARRHQADAGGGAGGGAGAAGSG